MTPRRRQQRRESRRILAAVALSLLLHAMLILGAAWVYLLEPAPPWEPAPPEEIEITFVEPVLPRDPQRRFVRTSEQQIVPRPENAMFESDRDSQARSERPPDGELPLPSQEGDDVPFIETQQRALALAEPRPEPPAPVVPPQVAQAAPPPAETREETKPEPAPTPAETRKEAREDPLYAVARPQPRRDAEPRKREPETAAPAEARPPTQPSFQPQTRPTRIQGSLSNRRGPASLDAIGTPLGRYKKQISDAIGSRWYYYIGRHMDLVTIGSVQIQFVVNSQGRVIRPRVVSNTSNESFEIFSLQSILDAQIPPIPEDVAATLENGQMEIEYTFTILSN